jgi:ribosome biogenesis GTPase
MARDLTELGWNEAWQARFDADAPPGTVPARVALEHNHVYRVFAAADDWLAEATGRVKHQALGRHELPAVGDWVAVRPPTSGERGTISWILPRRSKFSRKAAGRETEEQVVAANIDTVFLVAGLDHAPKLRSLERYLVLARQSGAAPVIVLNKADEVEDVAADVADVVEMAPEVPVHAVSARDGLGMDVLATYLVPGRTIALLGPSGAGKSSIVNRLAGREVLATGEVRPWDSRGRHTSVHRQLVLLDGGGIVIDTPGMRELQLWDAESGVDETFPEITVLAAGCRFRDCRHDREPGCAVKAAVEAGTLDGGRFESYEKLAREREAFDKRQDERSLIEAKRLGKIGSKAYRAMTKKRK